MAESFIRDGTLKVKIMAKKKKKGPDEGLTPNQYQKLNEEFYNEYFSDYFFIKFAVMANLVNQPEKMLEIFNDPQQNITFGELKVDPFRIEQEEIVKFGKLELSIMYYHCIETFLRIFLAHSTIPQCPWLEISRETNYRKFKSDLKKLSDGKFGFRDDLTTDEIITYVFTGRKQLPTTINSTEIIKSLKEWIQWSAKELLEVYDYNAYKHGLTVTTDRRGFTIHNRDVDEKLEEHEESLKIIHKHDNGDRWVWMEKVIFTRFDSRSSCILILQKLIYNILNVGKHTYLNRPLKKTVFLPHGNFTPHKILVNTSKYDNPFNLMFTEYSMELSYFEDKY
jgi:hypothetical protein